MKKLQIVIDNNPFQFPLGSNDVTERWRVIARILFLRIQPDEARIQVEQHNISVWTRNQITAYRQQFEINASGHNDGMPIDDSNTTTDGKVRSPRDLLLQDLYHKQLKQPPRQMSIKAKLAEEREKRVQSAGFGMKSGVKYETWDIPQKSGTATKIADEIVVLDDDDENGKNDF